MKTPLESVTISGTAQVGETLTATVAPGEATVSYKWKSGDTSDGSYTDIEGATAASYVLTESENGKYIKVETTGTGKYSGAVTSNSTEAVTAAGG